MDSGNTSGSMQSSSGGGGQEDEYDSRADSRVDSRASALDPINNTSFFTNNNNNNNGLESIATWHTRPDPIIPSDNNLYNHNNNQNQLPQPSPNPNPVRNPKKRSRASRRAPTTVLTTDTTNFRAMVQEFTGIPAPPFTSSPFPVRTRLDLFGSGHQESQNPLLINPLRPFAHKLQILPHHNNSSNSIMSGFNSLLQAPPRFTALAPSGAGHVINMSPFAVNWSDGNGNGVGDPQEGLFGAASNGKTMTASEFTNSNNNKVMTENHNNNNNNNNNGNNNINNVVSSLLGARSEGMVESWICSSD